MISVIHGASPSKEITLSADQIAWIASNPDEYKQNNAALVSLLDLITAEKLKLSKAKDLDKALKKAKENEANTENVLVEAKKEAEKVKSEANTAAKSTLDKAKESASNTTQQAKAIKKQADEAVLKAHDDIEQAKAYVETVKEAEQRIEKSKQGLKDKQLALQAKIRILNKAIKEIVD